MADNKAWFTYKVTILFDTPYISPALSPNKIMKKLQIQDLLRCYSDEFKDIVEHIDRAFLRDSQCNIFIPGHIFTPALREVLSKNSLTVRGAVIIPQSLVRIGTSKANNSLINYEYIPAGTIIDTEFKINDLLKEKEVVISIGARKFKGFGRVKLIFNLELPRYVK